LRVDISSYRYRRTIGAIWLRFSKSPVGALKALSVNPLTYSVLILLYKYRFGASAQEINFISLLASAYGISCADFF